MQTSLVEIALRGDALNTIVKTVNVPEALVLMAINGAHSITFIPGTIEESRGIAHPQELARLAAYYGAEPVEQCFGKASFGVRLPATFFEVGLNVLENPPEKPPEETEAQRKKRVKADKVFAALSADAKEKAGEPDTEAESGIGGAFAADDGTTPDED